jgi:signal transduction histidine kinase
MSLETVVSDNPIVRRTGRIEDPFNPRDVSTKYLVVILESVRRAKDQSTVDGLVDRIITNHLPSGTDRDQFLKYVNNEHNWANIALIYLFLEYAKEVLQIGDFYRFIGRAMANPSFLLVSAGELFGIDYVYRKVAELNRNFNSVTEMEFVKEMSRAGHSVIRRRSFGTYKARLRDLYGEDLHKAILRNDDLVTQGVLEAAPKAVSPDNDFAEVVDEPYCVSRGDDFCEYHLEWGQKRHSPVRAITKAVETGIVYRFPAVKKLVDKIFGMEVVIQQKTEQVEQRTAQLVQETNLGLLGRLSAQVAHELRTPQDATRNELELIKRYVPDLVFLHQDIEKLGLEEPIKTELYELIRQTFEQGGKVEYRTRSTIEALARDLYEDLKAKCSNITLAACKDIVAMGYETDISGLDRLLRISDPGQATGILRKVFNAGYSIRNALGSVTKEMSITNALLEHAHGDTKQIEAVDVKEKLSTTLTLYDRVIKDSGIKLETYYDEGLDAVECNAVRLNLAYRNVIQNAIDALKKKEGERILRVKTGSENGYAVVEISDNGPGIPPEDMEKLTHPTFTTKPIGEGTGLGLSIVYNILQEHNGHLEYSSTPGETTFRLKIPFKHQGKL